MNEYFSNRRSIRVYDKSRPVSDQLIESLLSQAIHAPNTGNMQLYSVVVTREPERLAALAPAHFSQPAIANATAALTFCLDMNRFDRWCRINGAEPGLANLQGFTWGVIDTAVVAQQFCTLAEMEGLGTCYLGTTTYNAPQIADLLKLPQGVVPVVTVTLGWPAENPAVQPRLPLSAVMHYEEYNDYSDSEIADIYAAEEALEENRKFVAENGKENLAQVFAEVRYPRDQAEHFSRLYKEFLKSTGISL
ncbi:MAG: nitroreductase family protein [Muribaculaceae bacterium]|nr:nitroreductase family protein [Muribaculaceae bacterium]